MPKDKFISELEKVNEFFDGLWAEGYFDHV
jgi:hypothetical protein